MKNNQGYTLTELLVVVVILGVLSAFSIPAFLAQATRARQAEGELVISNINEQQSFFFIENGRFAESFAELGIAQYALDSTTDNYAFAIQVQTSQDPTVITTATPVRQELPGWAGKVYITDEFGTPSDVRLICQGPTNVVPDVSAVATDEQCPEPTEGP